MNERLPPCFKAYDVRGRVPDDLDEALAEGVGRAFVVLLLADRASGLGHDQSRTGNRMVVAVGRDVRESSPMLANALIRGLRRGGADVLDLGLCGTEMIYFATFNRGLDGGIMVTASHNPKGYNGLKLVRVGARPVSGDTGLHDLGRAAVKGGLPDAPVPGNLTTLDITDDFVAHLLTWVDIPSLKPLTIVVDAGNGCAGPVVRRLGRNLPFRIVESRFEPDGTFPTGVPNPLLPGNRTFCADAVRKAGAAFGVAFDGDFDRCFFFDGNGDFVEGYYLVGLLATQALRMAPGSRIIHDPRLTWNTVELVTAAGGTPVCSKTGHAFIKERMRTENAVYGGEMSAHHYFRRFGYCDSGMIPWLLVAEHLSRTGGTLREAIGDRMDAFPCSGEINRKVEDIETAVDAVRTRYLPSAKAQDTTDGLSLEFRNWRFNLRGSNTEPLLRLNVETRGDRELLEMMTLELLGVIGGDEA
jgi:phosphomannomutase